MQKKCDIYFCGAVNSARIKFVELFDEKFLYDNKKLYSGFLQINVNRIKLISIITDLRSSGINCYSVPIDYRDQKNISKNAALDLAAEYSKTIATSVAASIRDQNVAPVFWIFDLKVVNSSQEKSGGVVMIDRLDGHVWSDSEYEEYFYDYNNIF